MKSDDITIQQLFQDRRQYMVPFYQRAYVWTLENQWDQLWEDIQDKAESRFLGGSAIPHFLGAVVLDPQPRTGLIGVDTLHIIDGQQRLTTLQFVLKAVELTLQQLGFDSFADIVSSSLRNGNSETMRDASVEIFKVWPTFRDRATYKNVLGAESIDSLMSLFPDSFTQRGTLRKIGTTHPPAFHATWYFSKRCAEWIEQGEPEEQSLRAEMLVTSILQDLKIVSIVLDGNDDAQVIFETLNGRGATLHATDLIRNFIFMRADRDGADSEDLYDAHWSQFESNYWSQAQRRGRITKPRLEWFIHATLQAERHDEVDLGRMYHEYRRYVFADPSAVPAEAQLGTLTAYANHYRALVDATESSPIARFGRRTQPFDLTTTHPLALLIASSQDDAREQQAMFEMLVSYIVRRTVCGLTQKNYNNVFLSLLRNLSRSDIRAETLYLHLTELTGEASRWPEDGEFENACREGQFYPRGGMEPIKVRAILAELEEHLRSDSRVEDRLSQDLSHLDIDHILPQSWFQYWPLVDGSEIGRAELTTARAQELTGLELDEYQQLIIARDNSVRTLGNLTLLNLSVNREAQNKAFETKQALLIENTNLRLNVPLLSLDRWDEDRIAERGSMLATAALRIWPRSPPRIG